MKVLIITNLFPTTQNTTSGIFITNRLKEYTKFNVEYKAVSLGYEDSATVRILKKILRKKDIKSLDHYGEVFYLPITSNRSLIDVIKLKLNRYENLARKYAEIIQAYVNVYNYDIVHAHGMFQTPAGEVAKELAIRYHKPFVVTLHGDDVNFLMEKRKKSYVLTLEKSSKVIFVSKALLDKACRLGYNPKNSVVIQNGYNPKIFYPLDKELVRSYLNIQAPDCKYVGFVGALELVKRADALIKIFRFIREKIHKIKFIVVGDGTLGNKLKKEAERAHLDVLFTGWINQSEVMKY
ncbi:glycosyltransferase, partial [Pseudothermotoga sp.]|uniref:glycosyltransferase n=1 Tax=Pseudothermotoga sp. TaxID=2033661 RepID=UPI0031F6C838